MIIRAFLEILLSNVLSVKSFYIDRLMQMFMYGLIVTCLWRGYVLNYKVSSSWDGGDKNLAPLTLMLALACILFSYGSMTLVANLGSYINPEIIYRYFNFHVKKGAVYDIFSWRVLIFIMATVIVAPIVEEIVFRGMLLSNFVKRRGPVLGVTLASITFTAFHFLSPDLIGTFVFSVIISTFYLKYKSIRACMATHSLYNLIAFVYQYYFGWWWIRPIGSLKDIYSWDGGYLALVLSLMAFLSFYKFGYIRINKAQD